MRERAYEIDVMKGIGILLVILGHCMPDFPVNILEDPLSSEVRRFIYTFHMPMFFFCSGFVCGITPPRPLGKELSGRFWRLVVPYLVFSLANLGLRLIFSSVTRSDVNIIETIKSWFLNGGYYWFVYVLFILMFIVTLLKPRKWGKWALIALSLVGIYIYYLRIQIFCLEEIGWYTLFVVLGFCLAKYRSKLLSIMKNYWIPIGLTILLIVLFFTISVPDKETQFVPYYIQKLLMALIGLFAFYGFAVHPINNKKVSGFIEHFSKYSLQYYLIHEITSLPCFYVVPALHLKASIFAVLINFVLVTLSSYLVLKVILLNKWCYKLVGIK